MIARTPARVLVVDDHASFADAVCLGLAQTGVETCEAVTGIDDALRLLEAGAWDVVLLDAFLDGRSGVDGAREMRQRWPHLRLVMITGGPDLDLLADAAEAGVDAFLSKEASFDELCAAVLDDGQDDLGSHDLLAMAADAIRSREQGHLGRPPLDLTPREREVLGLLARGVSIKQIAGLLGITVETCRGYVKSLLTKLGARSQLQAVVMAGRRGLLDDHAPFGEAKP